MTNREIKELCDEVLLASQAAVVACLVHAENVRCAVIFDRMAAKE